MYDVIIIGAGPAGLTTACTLLQKAPDMRVLVLEQDSRYVGGISRTVEYKGYRFDIGGHRFFTKSKPVQDFWNATLPNDFIDRPRLSRIFYKNKFFSYPLKPFEAFAKLGPITSVHCFLSYLYAKAFPISPATTYHAWVRNNFGERLFSIFFKTYTEKVWGMSCDALSADWAAQRIKGLNLIAAILSALRPPKAGKTIKTLISSFKYPRLGPGMMWEAAARDFTTRGGTLLMGQKVTNITKTPEHWQITLGDHTYQAKHIVSSAPLAEIWPNITPTPNTAATAKTLGYRDFITVALMLDTAPAFDDNWIYIHDPSVHVGRIQNFTSWSPAMVPASGKGCLGLEYFCNEGDTFWQKPDAELAALAKAEAVKIGLIGNIKITDACVVRQPKAYPVYDADYKQTIADIMAERDANYSGFHPIGRNGMHRYNNQDHAMMTGMLTAENILAGAPIYDVLHVNEDAEYHEEITPDNKPEIPPVFAPYFAISLICLCVDYAAYMLGLLALPATMAGALSYLLGAGLHYGLAKKHVFKTACSWLPKIRGLECLAYIASALIGTIITAATIWALTSYTPIGALLAKGAAVILSFTSVYAFRRYILFKKP